MAEKVNRAPSSKHRPALVGSALVLVVASTVLMVSFLAMGPRLAAILSNLLTAMR
jgi:hypothetical protein